MAYLSKTDCARQRRISMIIPSAVPALRIFRAAVLRDRETAVPGTPACLQALRQAPRNSRIGLPFGASEHGRLHSGGSRPRISLSAAELPSFVRLPPVNESAATGRYIPGQQTHDRRFHERPEIRLSIKTI